MDARYFRYLFENVPDGIIQWGSIVDTRSGEKVSYIYLSENNLRRVNIHSYQTLMEVVRNLPEINIDLLVLGEFKVFYLMSLLEILKARSVQTVVFPYIPPAQRKILAESLPFDPEMRELILRPYRMLQRLGVPEIHCLYGNGKPITKNPDGIPEGIFFEPAEREVLQTVAELEGRYLPLEKAGYLVWCDWLFYFGVFGLRLEDIYTASGEERKDRDMPVIQETVTMFTGPLHDGPSWVNSMFTGKTFTRELRCMRNQNLEDYQCDMRCIRYQDHSVLKQHTKKDRKGSCFGVMLLGNLNLKEYMAELTVRYNSIGKRIRILTIPDGANFDKWNPQILAMFSGSDFRYWIAAMNRSASEEVLKDIVFSNAYYRLVHINAEFGSCFSGYLVDKEDA